MKRRERENMLSIQIYHNILTAHTVFTCFLLVLNNLVVFDSIVSHEIASIFFVKKKCDFKKNYGLNKLRFRILAIGGIH